MRWHCATWTCSLFTFTHILTYSICQSNVVERLNIALYEISNISIGRKGRVCTIYNVANCYWIKVNDDFFFHVNHSHAIFVIFYILESEVKLSKFTTTTLTHSFMREPNGVHTCFCFFLFRDRELIWIYMQW